MSVSPEWIEQSLARLEEAETERHRHERALESMVDADELRRTSQAIERLDAEIQELYAKLEEVAGEGDGDEVEEPAPSTGQPAENASAAEPAPSSAQLDDYDPFGPPPAMAASEPASASAGPASAPAVGTTSFPTGDADYGAYDDLDAPQGGGLKWAIAAVVVLGSLGGGGYLYQQQRAKAAAAAQAPADPGPVQVIKAAPVPDDTQGPQVAKGADADRTPGTKIRAGGRSRGTSRKGGAARRRSARKKPGRTLDVDSTNDPLAGVN